MSWLPHLTVLIGLQTSAWAHASCADVFFLPLASPRIRTSVIEIDKGRLEFSNNPSSKTAYQSQMSKLSKLIKGWVRQRVKVETVLYPMTGFDGSLPFILFPDAKLVIGVDENPFISENHPLLRSGKSKFTVETEIRGQAWASTAEDVRTEDAMIYPVLQTLPKVIPGFRLRSIKVFKNRNKSDSENYVSWDGLIEFDSGPGTPKRKYIHIQRELYEMPALHQANDSWWSPFLASIDAIVIKGSNNALDPREEVENLDEFVPYSRKFLREVISNAQQPLLLLEGQSQSGSIEHDWELRRKTMPEFSGLKGLDKSLLEPDDTFRINGSKHSIEFSYGNSIYLSLFEPNP